MTEVKYTNKNNIPLILAVMLVDDTYDYKDNPNYLSATSLLKPTRQLILEKRALEEEGEVIYKDLSELIARSSGTNLHTAVEEAWLKRRVQNLKKLGYTDEEANSYLVNPSDKEISNYINATGQEPNIIYIEKRGYKDVGKYTIGGKFDFVENGKVNDNKETSTFNLTSGKKDDDYINQGSIYRWLHPDIITEDTIKINFVFKNFMPTLVGTSPEYPEASMCSKEYPLKSITQIDLFIREKVRLYDENRYLPESEIIECPESELWMDEPKYKYFANKSTYLAGKNCQRTFNNEADANAEKLKRGKGIVVFEQPIPKRCTYCDAYNICSQKDKYFS